MFKQRNFFKKRIWKYSMFHNLRFVWKNILKFFLLNFILLPDKLEVTTYIGTLESLLNIFLFRLIYFWNKKPFEINGDFSSSFEKINIIFLKIFLLKIENNLLLVLILLLISTTLLKFSIYWQVVFNEICTEIFRFVWK